MEFDNRIFDSVTFSADAAIEDYCVMGVPEWGYK